MLFISRICRAYLEQDLEEVRFLRAGFWCTSEFRARYSGHGLSRLVRFGHSMTLGLGFPTLKEMVYTTVKEAESLHLGLLSSRDGFG